MTNFIYIIPSPLEFAQTFNARLTPPYAESDAASDAQISVLNNVRMAYVNGDQIPIPAGTSAEAAVAHLIKVTALDSVVANAVTPDVFVGSRSLRAQSEEASGELHSPFLLLEEVNDYNVGIYAFQASEIAEFFDQEFAASLHALYGKSGAAVISLTENVSEAEADIDDAYAAFVRSGE